MDDYPANLAPEFEEGGAVKTPFDEWWAQAQPSFPNVPVDVARQWLHRHWKHSPYSYLISKNYRFDQRQWADLKTILTRWSDFKAENAGALEKGEELVNLKPDWMPYVPKYMLEHSKFPAPIIVLDNQDGHHDKEYPKQHDLPSAYVLVEGHTRFNVGIYLQSAGKLNQADVWLMTRV
ncbi:hypothetical protein [Bradyrhizobium sp. CCBAU 051011]|uniref:hypothetical protein n=1 Tax=Bradyrhizobium sp. CCBAU 051011 TaxID=858422 RepID=UPI001379AC78|nr:hypothetical protein [Bradyrhizobium sp. CCBAU 051011]